MFLSELRRRAAGQRRQHSRDDVTAVLNALRGAIDVDHLLEYAPGLDAKTLYSAYKSLDGLRRQAESAWRHITEEKTAAAVFNYYEPASKLLKKPAHRLAILARAIQSPRNFANVVDAVNREVEGTSARILTFEKELCRHVPRTPPKQLQQLVLLWNSDCWLPNRVTSLPPVSVQRLLGECG